MPDKDTTRVIFFGDVSGRIGRQGVRAMVEAWQKKYQPDIFIANVENLAHNKGVTLKTLQDISDAGIKIMTGGNHIWDKYDVGEIARETDYALACPANDARTPSKFKMQSQKINGTNLVVINLVGQTFIDDTHTTNPFHKIEDLLKDVPTGSNIIIDMHAETTSEKRAMGFMLDGRVSAIVGSHTHVPTADAQILEKGSAYITDIGMVGPFNSVLGVKKEVIIQKFLSADRIKHELPETGQIEINAVLLDIDNKTNLSTNIQHLREIL